MTALSLSKDKFALGVHDKDTNADSGLLCGSHDELIFVLLSSCVFLIYDDEF
jgi:hypothetical protein